MFQFDVCDDIDDYIVCCYVGLILYILFECILWVNEFMVQMCFCILLLVGEDCIYGYLFWLGVMIYLMQFGMVVLWDFVFVECVVCVMVEEVVVIGIYWMFLFVLCIVCDLCWGCIDEMFGEDLFLIGELVLVMVCGYQGDGFDDFIVIFVMVKYFVGYFEIQGGCDVSEVDIFCCKLCLWFLLLFECVVCEGCCMFMFGYQIIDGVLIIINDWLFSDVL